MKKIKKITKAAIKRAERISKRKKLVEWSKQVIERDGYTCQICGIKKGELTKNGKPAVLNSHHILAKEGFFSFLMFETINGISLCQNCHRFSRMCSPHRQEFVFFVKFMEKFPEWFSKIKEIVVDKFQKV